MVNRPAGGARSKRWEPEPDEWYCEGRRPVEQLLAKFRPPTETLIWDPACGRGNILDVYKDRGFKTIGSDIVDRHDLCREDHALASLKHLWFRADVVRDKALFGHIRTRTYGTLRPGQVEVVCNPPYEIAEPFIRAILDIPLSAANFLLPIAFLCGAERGRGLFRQFRPSHVAILSERPSCPPGSTLDPFTKFTGGMADYVWLRMRPPHRWRTETVFLLPD